MPPTSFENSRNRLEHCCRGTGLWAENFLNRKGASTLAAAIAEARRESAKSSRDFHQERSDTTDEIADIWFDILTGNGGAAEDVLKEFQTWAKGLRRSSTWTKLARLAARTPNFEDYACEFSQRAFERMKDAKESAESEAGTYVELARSILATNQSEAREYFNKAIEVSGKIGDEILDRWSAMLDLADRAADPDLQYPRAAYKLARCAELAYHYVYRDKHFAWKGTAEAIAGLCPSSCFAILSRWRDRDFGESKRLIVAATGFLLDRRRIDPKAAAALRGLSCSLGIRRSRGEDVCVMRLSPRSW